MADYMSIWIKEPGERPIQRIVSNDLRTLQGLVGGNIELLQIGTDFGFLVNEEGMIRHLPFNCISCGMGIYGTMLFIGLSGEEFCSFPSNDRTFIEGMYDSMF